MANNPSEAASDDFLESILGYPSYGAAGDNNLRGNEGTPGAMMLQLGSSDGSPHLGVMGAAGLGVGIGRGYGVPPGGGTGGFPSGLNLDQGKSGFGDGSGNGNRFLRDDLVDSRGSASSVEPSFHAPPMANTAPAAPHPQMRPRVRARRGQATDPHSIAERLRRERIAEKIRALQELVPNVNKTDKAAMLDEIMDYVKFLRLQVKVLSMSRLGGAGAVAPLVMDIPISSIEDEGSDGGRAQPAWEKWSNDGTEREVVKLIEENTGAAMQFLQSKGLCIMPISLASAIYRTQPPETSSITKPKSNTMP